MKITKRIKNEKNVIPILNRNSIFNRRELNFVDRMKDDFEVRMSKNFADFLRNEKIER